MATMMRIAGWDSGIADADTGVTCVCVWQGGSLDAALAPITKL